MIYRKKRWISQPQTAPQIDWSNPLARGLVVARVPGDDPSGGFNLAVDGIDGRGRYTTKSGALSTNSAVVTNTFSFYVLFKTQATLSGILALLVRGNSSGASNTGFGFNVAHTNASYAGAFYVGDSYTIIGKPAGTLTTNTEYSIAGTFDGSNGRGYSNGVQTVGPTAATIFNTVANLRLNQDSVGAVQNTSGVYVVFYWNRVLSNSEIASLNNNPWQLFAPQTKPLFFSTQGTAGQTLTPSLFTNSNTFYSATVTPGAVTLTPDLFTNSNTFYSATVTQSGATQTLTPGLLTNTNSFYSPTLTAGAVTLTPDLFTNGQTFYAPTVTQGAAAQTLTPGLYENTNVFYSPTVSPGTATLTPSLYQNTNAFYSPTVVQATEQTILPDLFVNANEFYRAVVDDGIRRASQDATPGYATPRARYRVRVGRKWMEVDPLDPMSVRRAYDAAQEDAQDAAAQDVQAPAAVAAQAVVVQPIKGPDYAGLAKEARRISEDIRKVYSDTLQTALIARLMREQIERDDEDDIAVLLASI